MSRIEIKRNVPNVHRFVASDVTAVTWRGPDHEITKTAPTLVQDGSSDRYTCALTPDEYGVWLFTTEDGSGNITHSQEFECVRATQKETSLGLQNTYESLVSYYPPKPISASSNAITQGTGTTWAVAGGTKITIPWDGYVYGIKLYGRDEIASFDSVRFFTASGATNALVVRGISEDIKDHTPLEGAWGAAWAWKTVMFNKPVFARGGDLFGFESVNDSGGDLAFCRIALMNTTSRAAQAMGYKAAALTLGGATNDLSTVISADPFINNGTLACELKMHAPAIAVAGHSFWASHSTADGSHTQFEDSDEGYVRANDLAAMLSDRLGVPVANIADGGTGMGSWLTSTGLTAVNAGQVRPAAMLFDTTYNDTSGALSGLEYMAYLDRLLAHCDKLNIELILLEGPGVTYAEETIGSSAVIETYNQGCEEWAWKNGIVHVPLRWRLCRTKSGQSARTRRIWYDGADDGLDDYAEAEGVHPSLAGRTVIANAIAGVFKNRMHSHSKLWFRQHSLRRYQFLL